MSPPRFDPDELEQPSAAADRAITELERYAMASDADAPRGLSDRVMAAIEHEPAPRRGFLAWLTSPSPAGGPGPFVRMGAVAATLVLAVAGALFAGQLADLMRDVGNGPSPTPSVLPSPFVSPSVSPSALPSPSSSETPSPSGTPEESDDHGGSGEVETAEPAAQLTPDETPDDTPEETRTPRPSATDSSTAN